MKKDKKPENKKKNRTIYLDKKRKRNRVVTQFLLFIKIIF